MGQTIDPRKDKIRKLKNQIKEEQDKQTEIILELKLDEVSKLPEEEQKKLKKEWQDKIQIKKVEIENLKEELKQTRLNKNSSSFFEWMPTRANRRMRRQMRKMKRV